MNRRALGLASPRFYRLGALLRALQARVIAVAILGLVAVPAHAAVVNVDTSVSYATFAEAYGAANNGETLELDDGTYALSNFALDKGVDIRAKSVGGAIIAGNGVATGFPVVISADMTFSGLQFTAATAAFSLRDQDITVTVEDAIFRGMNHGVTHQNIGGGTVGQIVITRATFYDLVEEAVYVNSGGAVIVNDAVFVDLPALGLLLGDNEGADTLQVNGYVLANTANTVSNPSLATLSGLVGGTPVLADPDNGNYALIEGTAGVTDGFGINLVPAPRVTVGVTGNSNAVNNGDTATTASNLTDFGSIHVSGNQTHQFTINNAGFADELLLTPVLGDFVRVSGADEDQFSVLTQPSSDSIAPQESISFQIHYSPVSVGAHQTSVIFNNNVDDPYVFRVTGEATNTAPVANGDTSNIDEDSTATVAVLANDTDADADDLFVSSATLISGQGLVTHQPNLVEYVPDANFNGAASISYVASDGHATDTATVDITVAPVNDAPEAAADTGTTDEDTTAIIDVLANDTDVDGDVLTISSAAVSTGGGNVVVNAGKLEYTPAANVNGDGTLSYVVSDGALTDTATVTMTINPVNDAPVAVADSATATEDTTVVVDVLANDIDVDGDALSINSAAVQSGHGSVVINAGALEYTPAADNTANTSLSYVVSDGALTDTGEVAIAIDAVNDAPVAVDDSATTAEDTVVVVDVLANDTDVDGDTLTIGSATIVSGGGSVAVNNGLVEYTPTANSAAGATLSYVVSDGTLTDTGNVSITVTAVNDAPITVADSSTTAEDTAVVIDVLANDSDPEGDTLTLASATVESGAGGVVVNNGLLEYTPATDDTAGATLSYLVSDGELTATGSVSVDITPVNDAPVASDDNSTTEEDTTVVVDVLANDSDVDGDTLTLTSAAITSGTGNVVVNNNALEYTPAANASGNTTLSYVVSDGALTDTASVSIAVTAVNDAPVAVPDSATTAEDTPVLIDVLANDADIDGDALAVSSAAVVSGGGSVEIHDGGLEFTPAADSVEGVSISYVVSDGALTATATAAVTITPVNDSPVVRADTTRGHYLDAITIDVLANDFDVDGDGLSITVASADRGDVQIVDNQVIFSLGAEWVPQATVSYTISDGSATAAGTAVIDLNEYQGPLVIGSGEVGAQNGALSDASFGELYSIVVGINGQLFTADSHVLRGINIENNRTYSIIDNDLGHQDGPIRQAQFGAIEGMVYDAENAYLYISEVSKGSIRRFDLRRDTVNTIRRGLQQPIGLALSNDRNTLYVIEHGKARVLSLNLLHGEDSVLVGNGQRGFQDGVGEAAQIDVSVGLTVGPDGTVYLADRGNGRVRAINPDTREIRTISDDFAAPSDIVVRDANTLMVLDRSAHQIKRLNLRTNEASVLGSTDGQLLLPVAMTVDDAGTLYVADTSNHQIKAFSIEALERTQSGGASNALEALGHAQQDSYFIRDIVGTGHAGTVTGLSSQANLLDPDQVVIAGENIIYHSSRQFTLMRTDLNTGETVAVFPDYDTNTLVEATAYGLGISRWGHIDGLSYSVAQNRLYVFAGRNTLFQVNLDDNSFTHVTVSGLASGGDFALAVDGTLYMADREGNRIVQLDPDSGEILQTFESNNGVTLSQPTDVAFASNGDLYIANWGLREVVKLKPQTGELSHFIFRNGGFADGHLASAVIGGVYGLEFGDNDVLYLADRLNHAVRMVDIRDDSPILLTMAGSGAPGVISPNGARFNNPTSLAVDFHGTVVVTDDGNNRIRLVGQNLSRPLSPFDAPVDLLGTNPDGSPVVEGTLPLGRFPIVRNSPILQAAVDPIPMFLVDADERAQQLDGVTYTTLEGDVTIEIPGGVNGGAFRVNGARLMAYSTEELNDDDEIETNNAFFIRVSLRRFTASFLQSAAGSSGAISSAQLSNIVRVLPDVEMLIAYSDKNLDSTPIEDLPQNLQDFFAGIFDPRFGVPIFNDRGSINTFLVKNFDSLPALVKDPLDFLGIDQQFISNQIGLQGGILNSAAVENIGFLIDVIGFIFPALQPDVAKEGSDFAIPTLNFGVVLPGAALPAFMRDAVSSDPLFQIIGFEPDPGVQLRYFLNVKPEAFLKAELEGDAGVEGALLVNMPNILNANALRDAPGVEPLEMRINLTAFLSGQLGGAGLADAEIGIKGSLQLVNYWNNPFGLQGIGFGDASILIGAQGAAGAALNNVGAGVDVFGGISGQFACLDEDDEILGLPSNAAVYFGFKVGVPPLPTGFGVELSPGPGGMTFGDHVRCRVRLFNSLVLGMGDTLLGALPAGPEREAIRQIQESARGSFKDFERILFTPLEFEPVRALLDGVRFAGDLYLATPDVELPNRFGTVGLRSGGRLEIRESADAPWVAIADALIDIDFENGVLAKFGLNDYNIADLIVMEDVQGEFDFKISNPLDAKLNLTGSQKFFGLQSATSIDMSVRNGVTIDSQTSIDNLGEVAINAATTGSLDNWPPVGPGGGIDFAGQARFDLNPNHVADQIHGAVNGVLNDANSAYRDALNVLSSRSREEQELQRLIDDLEGQIRDRTQQINDRLRPGFNDARARLASARRHVSNIWSDIRYFERRKDASSRRCSWPPHTWGHCKDAAYWWGREKFSRGLVAAANVALDIASRAVSRAESALERELYKVARALSPRLNAFRIAIVGLRTARDLAAITVRGLQAANNDLQSIGNALRDASNVQVHDASASIDSLLHVIGGLEPMRADIDIQVLDLRCQAGLDVTLPRVDVTFPHSDPFASLRQGIFNTQSACASDRHETTNSQRRVALRKHYFAQKLQNAGSVFANTAAAANDDVAAASVIDSVVPVQLAADNTDARTGDEEFASDLNSNTLWWRWQPPSTGTYVISAAGGLTDTTLQLHRAEASAPSADTLIAADFIPAANASLQVTLDADQDYLIGVGSQFGLPGAFTLSIRAVDDATAPVNDALANATVVTGLGGNTGGNNAAATVEAGETAGDSLPINATVWWRLDVSTSGLYTVNTLGSDVDTVLRAYRPGNAGAVSADNLVWQKTADDISVDPRSELTLFAQQGESLWFSVGSKYANVGQIEFNWQYTALDASQLQGDSFVQPIALGIADPAAVRSNVGATTELGEPLHAGASNAASIWYRFTAPETGNYLFDTTGSGIDTALAIYTGDTLAGLTELASSDGTRTQTSLLTDISYSAFRVNLQAGQQYAVAQAGIDSAEGDVVLNVQRFSLNDMFESPVTIAPTGGAYSADVSAAELQAAEPDYAEILARDYLPEVVLASLSGLSGPAQAAGVEVPVDADLLGTLDTLHVDALADLRARPAQHSLWYRYTATQSGDLTLNTLGSEPDVALVLFTGDALDNLQALAWNDDIDNGTDSHLRYPVEQGQTYIIALVARSSGIVRLAASLVTPDQQTVANDTPDTATVLSGRAGQVQADNTYAAQTAGLDTVLSAQDGQRLWWRFDAADAGVVVADTQGAASDTVIEVYRDNFGTLELVTLNDNFNAALTSSRVRFEVEAGRSYWIAVDTLNGGGSVSLNYRFETALSGPANDRIEQATVITQDVYSISTNNTFAQFQPGELFLGANQRPNSVWYQWTPTTSGVATISTHGSDIDTLLGVYLGAQPGDLQLLESNDDAADSDPTSVVSVHVVAGVSYYIAVAGKRDVQGPYSLSISVADDGAALASNMSIATATQLTGQQPEFGTQLTHVLPEPSTGSDLVEPSGQEASSRWWQWHAPDDGQIEITTRGSAVVPQLEIYQGESAQTIVLLDADKGAGDNGAFSRVTSAVQAGRIYYIRVTSPFSFQGNVSMAITYVERPQGATLGQLAGDSGNVAAAIVAAGTKAWEWVATDNGYAQFALSAGDAAKHSIRVFALGGGTGVEVTNTFSTTAADATPTFEFVSDKGAAYRIEVTSTEALLGNAELTYSYISRKAVDMDSAAGRAFIASLRPFVSLTFDAQGIAAPTLAASAQTVATLMADLLAGTGVSAGQLEFTLHRGVQSAGATTLADVQKVRFVATDKTTGVVLLSAVFNPNVGNTSVEKHDQVLVDSPSFTRVAFAGSDNAMEQVAVQMDRSSFNNLVAQAFVSVEQVDVSGQPRTGDQDLLLGATAYLINLDLYDSDNQRYPLETDQSVLRSVQVQLPIDTDVLLGWLGLAATNLHEAQRLADLAISQGVLTVRRADTVAALLAGNTAPVSGDLIIDLSSGTMSFSTDHFSVFSLVGVQPASVIDDNPTADSGGVAVNAETQKSGAFDVWTLLALLMVFGGRQWAVRRRWRGATTA